MMIEKLKGYSAQISMGVLCIFCFIGGWTINGWRLNSALMSCEASAAKKDAGIANAAVANIDANLGAIKASVGDYQQTSAALSVQLTDIKKGMKNATILPADCRPDSVRVRILNDAIRAANDTAIGQPAIGTMRGNTESGS